MPRLVTIASASVESDLTTGVIDRAMALADDAGRRRADIVCLPEYVAADLKDGQYLPQPVPGPATDAFAAIARQHRMYVIVPLVEANPRGLPFNTAVLLDRSGQIVGRYRKTHLCLPHHAEGCEFTPGDQLPVFKTDFAPIAITICMDLHYPEVYAALALDGAEIIFWPTGAMDYTGDLIESLVNARAIDNQVFFVPSHYVQLPYLVGKSHGRSRIVDCMGRIRADTGHFPGVALATVDLDQTYPMWYSGPMLAEYPTMNATLKKTRRPELYGPLTRPVTPADIRR